MIDNKKYLELCADISSLYDKDVLNYSEVKEYFNGKIPHWVCGFTIISDNSYYFGEHYAQYTYKSYSDELFNEVKEIVLSVYGKLIINQSEMRRIWKDELPNRGTNNYRWVFVERMVGNELYSFEDNITKYCPLINNIGIDEMQFTKVDGESLTPENEVLEHEVTQITNIECAVPDINTVTPPVADGVNSSSSTEKPTNYYIPEKDKLYINWGIYADVLTIIGHNIFYPCYITGLSGNGKTLGVEQACANSGRELIIANITQETDEDDLLGGYRLINGDTIWQDGPVITAMKRGAVLLLDEIDYGTGKLSCLQSVLSGKAVLIKKTGEMVKPKAGFTIFATANTKGQGDNTGKFAGTNILNEAFLDRFPITLSNGYPPAKIEQKIMVNALKHYKFVYGGGAEIDDDDLSFIKHLSQWCGVIRKTFNVGAVSEVISTRRGVDILKTYVIFGNRNKAISIGVERFDEETRKSFAELYAACDGDKVATPAEPVPAPSISNDKHVAIDMELGMMWGESNNSKDKLVKEQKRQQLDPSTIKTDGEYAWQEVADTMRPKCDEVTPDDGDIFKDFF